MAALSTPTLVQPVAGATVSVVTFSATVTRAAPIYRDSATGTYKLGDADGVGTSDIAGLAVTPGVSTEAGVMVTAGPVELVGVTMVKGRIYCLGPVAGEIIPESDLASGCEVVHLGTAMTTTRLNVKIEKTGIII